VRWRTSRPRSVLDDRRDPEAASCSERFDPGGLPRRRAARDALRRRRHDRARHGDELADPAVLRGARWRRDAERSIFAQAQERAAAARVPVDRMPVRRRRPVGQRRKRLLVSRPRHELRWRLRFLRPPILRGDPNVRRQRRDERELRRGPRRARLARRRGCRLHHRRARRIRLRLSVRDRSAVASMYHRRQRRPGTSTPTASAPVDRSPARSRQTSALPTFAYFPVALFLIAPARLHRASAMFLASGLLSSAGAADRGFDSPHRLNAGVREAYSTA
jgi:hypothetical protein